MYQYLSLNNDSRGLGKTGMYSFSNSMFLDYYHFQDLSGSLTDLEAEMVFYWQSELHRYYELVT